MKKNMEILKLIKEENGKVGVPLLMYILGVPGVVCLFVWFFFFRS